MFNDVCKPNPRPADPVDDGSGKEISVGTLMRMVAEAILEASGTMLSGTAAL